jgi:HAD superfamily hydrolase (TIGR01509 family)
MTTTCILFDLGNVLLLHNAQRRLGALAHACGKREDEIVAFFARTGIIDRLDLGKADERDLASALSDFSGRTVTATEAIRLWGTVFEPNRPLWAELPRLKQRYTLGIFSNNPPFIEQLFPQQAAFDHLFLSSQFGAMKPDLAVYEKVQAGLALPPEQILFVDDKKENVDRAHTLGWNGIVFSSNAQLRADFTRLDIW